MNTKRKFSIKTIAFLLLAVTMLAAMPAPTKVEAATQYTMYAKCNTEMTSSPGYGMTVAWIEKGCKVKVLNNMTIGYPYCKIVNSWGETVYGYIKVGNLRY